MQHSTLAADRERHRALEDESQLFVLVPVLGYGRTWLEVDDRESHPLAIDYSSGDALPDSVGSELGERPEGVATQ